MKKLLIIWCILISVPLSGLFDTLTEINRYASARPEYPKPDNEDWLFPVYTKFHTSNQRTFFVRWLRELGRRLHIYTPRDYFSPYGFKHLLYEINELVKQYRPNGTNPWIETLKPAPGTQFVVFGELNGAFHSLVRDLNELKRLNLITNDLKLTPHTYLLFLGNAITNAPYQMETLALIFELMKKNIHQVVYLAGFSELEENWTDQGLLEELRVRARAITQDDIPYRAALDSIFEHLPWALYLQTDKPDVLVRCAYFSTSPEMRMNEIKFGELLDEPKYADFLATPAQGYATHVLGGKKIPTKQIIRIPVRIEGTNKEISFEATQGLSLKVPQEGATTWNVFSSPTQRSQKLYQFHNDSFALIKTTETLDQWTITQYAQDAFKQNGFSTKTFNLLSGLEKQNGLNTQNPILIGCTLDLTKSNSLFARRLQEGIEVKVKAQNERGGIKKRMLQVIFLDDQYTPSMTQVNVERFLNQYHTDILMATLGTATANAIIPYTKKHQVINLFPISGSKTLRDPDLTYIINLRNNYHDEASNLITYGYKTLNLKKFAFFYQDDDYGRGALEGALEQLKSYGITNWVEVSYSRNDPNISTATTQKLIDFDPDTILFFSTTAPSIAFIKKVGINRLTNKTLMALSFVTDALRLFLKERGLSLIISQNMPNPNDTSIELVKEYQADMKQFYPGRGFSTDSLEGYVTISILIYVLEHMDEPFTKEKIIAAIEKFKNFSFKGFNLNFDPKTRQLSTALWIDPGVGKWIQVQK